MIFRIENFGPIKAFEMDLSKDMHLLYGKNSVGKSYAVGVLYLVVKHLIFYDDWFRSNKDGYFEHIIKQNQKLISDELKEKDNININNFLHTEIDFLLNKYIINSLKDSLLRAYQINNDSAKIILKNNVGELTIKINENFKCEFNQKITVTIEKEKIEEEPDLSSISDIERLFYIPETPEFILLFNDDFVKKISPIKDDIKYSNGIGIEILESFIDEFQNNLHNLYILPASRSGLYPVMSSLGNMFAYMAQSYHTLNKEIRIPALPEIVADYFLNFSTANGNNLYLEVAKKIEHKILKGFVELDKINQKILFQAHNDLRLKLELSQTGSMISEISPLVIFLREVMSFNPMDKVPKSFVSVANYLGNKDFEDNLDDINPNKKNILIIEEPEAHLHPEAQIELMKIFADMVQNSNIKLILTSHSDYMFAELSNLMLGKKIDYQRVAAYHLVMEEGGSIDAKDMEVSEEGILDYNFVDVSEKLYNERMELFEQFNAEIDAP